MAQTPEGWVKAHVTNILDEHTVFYTMPMTMGYGRSGVPDIIACVKGLFITIEVKDCALRHRMGELRTRGKNKGKVVSEGGPTALQQAVMADIRATGGITLLVDRHNFMRLHDFFMCLEDINWSNTVSEYMEEVRFHAQRLDLWYERMPEL